MKCVKSADVSFARAPGMHVPGQTCLCLHTHACAYKHMHLPTQTCLLLRKPARAYTHMPICGIRHDHAQRDWQILCNHTSSASFQQHALIADSRRCTLNPAHKSIVVRVLAWTCTWQSISRHQSCGTACRTCLIHTDRQRRDVWRASRLQCIDTCIVSLYTLCIEGIEWQKDSLCVDCMWRRVDLFFLEAILWHEDALRMDAIWLQQDALSIDAI